MAGPAECFRGGGNEHFKDRDGRGEGGKDDEQKESSRKNQGSWEFREKDGEGFEEKAGAPFRREREGEDQREDDERSQKRDDDIKRCDGACGFGDVVAFLHVAAVCDEDSHPDTQCEAGKAEGLQKSSRGESGKIGIKDEGKGLRKSLQGSAVDEKENEYEEESGHEEF